MLNIFGQSSYGLEAIYQNSLFLNGFIINNFHVLTIFWNLFLAFIPLILLLWLREQYENTGFKKNSQKFKAIVVGVSTFLFLPNAPYVIADIRHLLNYCPIDSINQICLNNAWMITLFFLYSLIGWLVYYYILAEFLKLIKKMIGNKMAEYCLFLIIPIISLGVLLGLFNRWNSWDIFIYPVEVLRSILFYITDFTLFINWLVFSLFLYLLYFIGKFLFIDIDFYGLFKNR